MANRHKIRNYRIEHGHGMVGNSMMSKLEWAELSDFPELKEVLSQVEEEIRRLVRIRGSEKCEAEAFMNDLINQIVGKYDKKISELAHAKLGHRREQDELDDFDNVMLREVKEVRDRIIDKIMMLMPEKDNDLESQEARSLYYCSIKGGNDQRKHMGCRVRKSGRPSTGIRKRINERSNYGL